MNKLILLGWQITKIGIVITTAALFIGIFSLIMILLGEFIDR